MDWKNLWYWDSCPVQIYWCQKSSWMGRKEHKKCFWEH